MSAINPDHSISSEPLFTFKDGSSLKQDKGILSIVNTEGTIKSYQIKIKGKDYDPNNQEHIAKVNNFIEEFKFLLENQDLQTQFTKGSVNQYRHEKIPATKSSSFFKSMFPPPPSHQFGVRINGGELKTYQARDFREYQLQAECGRTLSKSTLSQDSKTEWSLSSLFSWRHAQQKEGGITLLSPKRSDPEVKPHSDDFMGIELTTFPKGVRTESENSESDELLDITGGSSTRLSTLNTKEHSSSSGIFKPLAGLFQSFTTLFSPNSSETSDLTQRGSVFRFEGIYDEPQTRNGVNEGDSDKSQQHTDSPYNGPSLKRTLDLSSASEGLSSFSTIVTSFL